MTTPDEIDIFVYENSLLLLVNDNTRYVQEVAKQTQLDSATGNEIPKFKVGDVVDTTLQSEYKPGHPWSILEVCKQNGFVYYKCKTTWRGAKSTKKAKTTVAIFRQRDISPYILRTQSD